MTTNISEVQDEQRPAPLDLSVLADQLPAVGAGLDPLSDHLTRHRIQRPQHLTCRSGA